jgi:hypothetical protein
MMGTREPQQRLLSFEEAYAYWQDTAQGWEARGRRGEYHFTSTGDLRTAIKQRVLPTTPAGPRGGMRVREDDLRTWLERRRLEDIAGRIRNVVVSWLWQGERGNPELHDREALEVFCSLYRDDTELIRRLDAHIVEAQQLSALLHALGGKELPAPDVRHKLHVVRRT